MFSFVRNYTQLSFKIFFAFFRTLKLISIVLSRPPQCLEGFPSGSDGKESACNVGDLGLIPGLGKIPGRKEQLPTPVFWPGEFHGQRSLAGYVVHWVAKSRTRLSNFHFHDFRDRQLEQLKKKQNKKLVALGTSL